METLVFLGYLGFTHFGGQYTSVLTHTTPLFGLLGGRLDLLGQLLQLLGEGGAEALDRGLDPVDAEFGGQLLVLEQVLVAGRLDRFGGLDRDRPVVLEAGRGRD